MFSKICDSKFYPELRLLERQENDTLYHITRSGIIMRSKCFDFLEVLDTIDSDRTFTSIIKTPEKLILIKRISEHPKGIKTIYNLKDSAVIESSIDSSLEWGGPAVLYNNYIYTLYNQDNHLFIGKSSIDGGVAKGTSIAKGDINYKGIFRSKKF